MRTFVLLALLMQWSFTLIAQESVKGVVVTINQKGEIESVPFANVYWLNSNYGTSTDSNGVFQLAIPSNARQLVVSYVGYQSDTLAVNDYNQPITVEIKRDINLKEVSIEARKRTSQMSFINPITTENISERELFKAACCNLSESFETNPSVDVSFSDAISGARHINMLGLAGNYSMISVENMPGIRGLGNAFGLSFIPGAWINSIQLSKGVGSVVNGYESISGQINVELKKPDYTERLFLNMYANQGGRSEINFVNTQEVSKYWSNAILLHAAVRPLEHDRNKDGFMDFPRLNHISVGNRWKFNNQKGVLAQIGLQYHKETKDGGQTEERIDSREEDPNFSPYTLKIESENLEIFTKTAYVFPKLRYKNIALQTLWKIQNQQSNYGIINYDVKERYAYANLIYQSIIGNSNHTFKTGVSFFHDDYQEQIGLSSLNRIENVPGTFFEYTYKPNANITLVNGIRYDYHNLYGSIITPRVHFRWAIDESTVMRWAIGSGQRTPNILTERQSLFATSRNIVLAANRNLPYGLQAEKAWTYGLNLSREFRLDYRDGLISMDFYRTEFLQQAVVDLDESPDFAYVDNLNGPSYANNFQIDISYELIKFLDLRIAYRWSEVMTTYRDGLRLQPLYAKNRAFANLAYTTKKSNEGTYWSFDYTFVWTGAQRIPITTTNPEEFQRRSMSPNFIQMNAQISRYFKNNWVVYLGVENLLDFRQKDPIINADNPYNRYFDASMVWGPIFGRNIYVGARYTLGKKE